MARCSYGSLKLRTGGQSRGSESSPGVDCLTFSVVPNLTALWFAFIERAMVLQPHRIIVGDCAGNLHLRLTSTPNAEIYPIFNHVHGLKLDWFMENVCLADYVFITDDDVFLLNPEPLRWAFMQMQADPNIAVVSLMPRGYVPSYLQGQVTQPMGSYCLVIRRDIWLKENLSFKVVRSPSKERIYDTGRPG